jgi:protein SCO1/2
MYRTGGRAGARLSLFGSLAFASLALAAALAIIPTHARAANSVTIGGPWTLIAPDGTTVTDRTYRGKWLLVFFGYTSCPNTCPITLHEIAVSLDKLGREAEQVQPLFITLDPQRDTTDVIEEYVRSFDARIVGLTGSSDQIAAAAKAFGVYYVAHTYGVGAQERLIDHSTYLYVMDPQGQFVRGFDADTPGGRIAATLHELLGQAHARASGKDR